MGKSDSEQYTTMDHLVESIREVLQVYRSDVLKAIEGNIKECGDIYIRHVKAISPPDDGPGIGGHYRNMWKQKPMRKAKYVTFVGNTKKVKAHAKDEEPTIPLINILEFSTKCGKPHVGKALSQSEDEILNLLANKIQKES